MTTIYLIRHAEAEGNLYRRVHGWYDSLITENGYRQIAALEERFRDISIDAVYSSDLFRTMTTAGAIYRPKGLELQTRPDLRELGVGEWEDRTWGHLAQTDPEQLDSFNRNDAAWQVEGSETFPAVRARMVNAVREIAAAHPGQTVAVVSHGMAIRSLLAEIQGIPYDEMHRLGHSDNTGVACIRVDGDKIEVVFTNDNSHLSEEISTLAKQNWWKHKDSSSRVDDNLWYRPLELPAESDWYMSCRADAWFELYGDLNGCNLGGFLAELLHKKGKIPRAYCAMLGDKQIGLLEISPDREKGAGWISFLYLKKECRGQGLGAQLLGQTISLFRAMGRDKLRLVCSPKNEKAQAFYRRHGFQVIGQEEGVHGPLDKLEKQIGYGPKK